MSETTATELFDALQEKAGHLSGRSQYHVVAIEGYRKLLAALEEHTKLHPPNRKRAICGLCKALADARKRILEARGE